MIIPDSRQALDLLSRYLPSSLLVGGGIAGIQHLLTMKNEQDKAMEENGKQKDVLVVPVAGKTASLPGAAVGALDNMFHTPEAMGAAEQAAAHADGAAAAHIDGAAAHEAGSPAANIGEAHTGFPIPDHQPGWLGKNWKWLAGLGGAGGAGLGLKSYNDNNSGSPTLLDAAAITGIVGGGLMGGHALVNRYIRNRKRKALAEQLEQSKTEFANLLGSSLSQKAASLDPVVEFPLIHGFLQEFANCHSSDDSQKNATTSSGMLLVGIPGALAVLSGIASHKWMYNRQKELAAMYSNSKPTPPRQIRLQTVPPPDAAKDDDEPLGVDATTEPEKFASLNELLDFVNQADPALLEQKKEEEIPGTVQSKVVKVAPGVVQIATPGKEPVEVEADSPASAAILNRSAPRLAKLLASFHSTPVSAMAA